MVYSNIFTLGNLVKLKAEYEDGHGPMVVYVTDGKKISGRHFCGCAVVSKESPPVGHYTNDFNKSAFEQFVGSIVLTGSVN